MLMLMLKEGEDFIITNDKGEEVAKGIVRDIKQNMYVNLAVKTNPDRFKIWRGKVWQKIMRERNNNG